VHKPIIAIGAPVACFVPQVADRLHTRCIIPPHAEVGNAVGAAVAGIKHTVEILVQPHVLGSGTLIYLVHSPRGREVLNNQEEAVRRAELIATEIATQRVTESGGKSVSVTIDRQTVNMGVLSEVTIRVCATERLLKKNRVKKIDEFIE
jgi:N-methylhydantoinase A/oxoprolinase/acetone carboxylase beta subunit